MVVYYADRSNVTARVLSIREAGQSKSDEETETEAGAERDVTAPLKMEGGWELS